MKRRKKNKAKNIICTLLFLCLLPVLAALVLLRMDYFSFLPAVPQATAEVPAREPEEESEPESWLPILPKTEPEEVIDETEDAEKLVISEVMFKNHATVPDEDGDFSDWIEIYNRSDAAVSLEGWSLSETDKPGWVFPDVTIVPGQYIVVFASGKDRPDMQLHTDFALGADGTVSLFNKHGYLADSLTSADDRADISTVHGVEGSVTAPFATPCMENTLEAYDALNESRAVPVGLIINEAMTANTAYGDKTSDLVEIKNTSDQPILLSDYALSDDNKDYLKWSFPDVTLQSGEIYLISCSDDLEAADGTHALFSLSSDGESLYLSSKAGYVVDYVFLHDVPVNGSMGRVDGQSGWHYFKKATPGEENTTASGKRVSPLPQTAEPDGAYNGVESVSVTLTGRGTVYYTLDGTVPTTDSEVYTEPIVLTQTGIVRAITVESGCLQSPVATFSYFINENHTLPIISVVADKYSDFRTIWNNQRKHLDVPGNVAFYDLDGTGFSHTCGIHLKGWTSLKDPKKSIGVSFGSEYGGMLHYDIYGNGIDEYKSLSIRTGQDYPLAMIRTELFQSLCDEMTDSVYVQQSKYCIMYVNGNYYGIYCMKEDITRQYYASNAGVSKNSVTQLKSPVGDQSELYLDVIKFCLNNNMAKEENYQYFCSKFDVDSIIDWFIIEGYCANSDINGNMRYYKSTENGDKWQIVYYDLDWTFNRADNCFNNILKASNNVQIGTVMRRLIKNAEFRDKLLKRYAEVSQTVLSDEHVLQRIDELAAELDSEVPRERAKWGSSYDGWVYNVNKLRKFITDNNYSRYSVKRLCSLLEVSEADRKEIFGF